MMVGLTIPLIALQLEARDLPASLIGLNTAMLGLAALVTAPLLPRLVKRFSVRSMLIGGTALSTACFAAYTVFDALWLWFLIRFLHGAAHTALFALSEFLINDMATPKTRGRLLGLYAALFAGGMAAGPLILLLTGTDGAAPFWAGAALVGLAGIPFTLARLAPPAMSKDESPSHIWQWMKAAPIPLVAALLFGLLEAALLQLMPIYAVRAGNTAAQAALIMTIVGAGNLLLQLPLGWLADRMNRRTVLVICYGAASLGAATLPFAIANTALLWPSLFVWAGLLFGTYPIALAILGDEYAGRSLLEANSAYVMLYSLGSLVGPVILGVGMDLAPIYGFPAMILGPCALFGGFIAIRTAMRARKNPLNLRP